MNVILMLHGFEIIMLQGTPIFPPPFSPGCYQCQPPVAGFTVCIHPYTQVTIIKVFGNNFLADTASSPVPKLLIMIPLLSSNWISAEEWMRELNMTPWEVTLWALRITALLQGNEVSEA